MPAESSVWPNSGDSCFCGRQGQSAAVDYLAELWECKEYIKYVTLEAFLEGMRRAFFEQLCYFT